MAKHDTLRPADLAIVLTLAVRKGAPKTSYGKLGQLLGLSSSTVFEGVQRLEAAGLLHPGTREPNRHVLRNFIEHGAKHAFPPTLGREKRGVPTAHSGPLLRELFDEGQAVVWPDAEGPVRGTALEPLYPNAITLPERAPEVYSALTLVDALRVGQARERKAALAELERLIVEQPPSSKTAS